MTRRPAVRMRASTLTASRGNALFLILIAVALFAALSYAVTQSGRGGGGIGREQAMIDAAQITQYASAIQQAVMRLRIAGGCADTQMNFKNDADTNYNNTLAPSDGSCDVFGAAGGMSYRRMTDGAGAEAPTVILGNTNFYTIGSNQSDLALYVPLKSKALCDALNAGLGNPAALAVDKISDNAVPMNTLKFKGLYRSSPDSGANWAPDDGGNDTAHRGLRAGCWQAETGYYPQSSGYSYFFYQVLLER